MITPQTIQQITSRIDIIDVVGEFVKLKKRGTNYIGNCPFHNEKSPSFTVSPAKEIYKCFGCGKAGNSIIIQPVLLLIVLPHFFVVCLP